MTHRMSEAQRPTSSSAAAADVSLLGVQNVFAQKPLFDDEVAGQLAAMERRTDPYRATSDWNRGSSLQLREPSPSPGHGWHGIGGLGPTTSATANANAAGNGGTGAYVLPPQIPRPLAVHKYLAGVNETLQAQQHQGAADGERFYADGGVEEGHPPRPYDVPPVLVPPVQGVDPYGGLVSTPRGGGRGQSRTPRRRSHRRHEVHEDAAQAAMKAEPLHGGTSSDEDVGGPDDVSSSMSSSRRGAAAARRRQKGRKGSWTVDEVPLVPDIEPTAWNVTTRHERVDANIEKAAMRSKLQQERLSAQGKSEQVGFVDGGVQTEPTATTTSATASPSESRTAATAAAAGGGRAPGEIHASNKTPPVSLLLSGPQDYKPVALEAKQSSRSNSVNSQWPIRPAPTASGFPSTGAIVSAATTEINGIKRGGDDVASTSAASGIIDGQGPTKEEIRQFTKQATSSLMERLDDLQLKNEEILVKNRALPEKTASGVAGQRARSTVAHVAEAYRHAPDQASDVPRPFGGYGSVLDAPPQQQQQQQLEQPGASSGVFSPSRWQGAKVRNEMEQLNKDSAVGSVDLRKWSTELPTSMSTTAAAGNQSATTGSSMRMEGGPHASYSARKKWANVSFATPLERSEGGQIQLQNPMEELSASAKALLRPTI